MASEHVGSVTYAVCECDELPVGHMHFTPAPAARPNVLSAVMERLDEVRDLVLQRTDEMLDLERRREDAEFDRDRVYERLEAAERDRDHWRTIARNQQDAVERTHGFIRGQSANVSGIVAERDRLKNELEIARKAQQLATEDLAAQLEHERAMLVKAKAQIKALLEQTEPRIAAIETRIAVLEATRMR